jgi:tetratricopeptide (TPR) repeat protein
VTRKKITQKSKRKDDLDPTKDQFISRSISLLDWAVERRRQIGMILGVGLLAAVAAIIVNRTVESRHQAASSLLGDALDAYFAPVVPPADDAVPPAAAPGDNEEDDALTYETSGARATESLKRFEQALADQGSSPVGMMAALGAAAAHVDLGENDKAIEKYEQFLENGAGEAPWLRPNALEGLGHALEAGGKLDEARARYKELAEQSEGRTQLYARYDEARIATLQQDDEAAVGLLKGVIDEVTADGQYDRLDFLFIEAGERLKQLDSEADVPALPGGGFGGLDGIDPAVLQQLLQAQAQAGGGGIQ